VLGVRGGIMGVGGAAAVQLWCTRNVCSSDVWAGLLQSKHL
jgi:hypothetical protein